MRVFRKALEGMSQEPDRSRALFTEAWAWREQLQRAMDGCHSTDDMSAHSLSEYDEYEGPNIPLPSGYQVPLILLLASPPMTSSPCICVLDLSEAQNMHCAFS